MQTMPPPLCWKVSARLLHLASQIMQGDQSQFLQRLSQRTVVSANPARLCRRWGSSLFWDRDIEEATDLVLKQQSRADDEAGHLTTWSFDMLGEGALPGPMPGRYPRLHPTRLANWPGQLVHLGAQNLRDRPGLSIKPSALHPRFEALSASGSVRVDAAPAALVTEAARHNILLTIDAEESHRLNCSYVLSSLVTRWNTMAFFARLASALGWPYSRPTNCEPAP